MNNNIIILIILITYHYTSTSLAFSPCLKEGRFANPFDCTKYYVCHFNGLRFFIHEFKCPNGLVFDQRISNCIEPNYAQFPCGNVHFFHNQTKYSSLFHKNSEFQIQQDKPSFPIANYWQHRSIALPSQKILDKNSENKCLKQGYFSVKNNCSKYYACFLNKENVLEKYYFNCPNGLAFDEWREICIFPDQVKGCENMQVTNKSNNNLNDHKNKNNGNKHNNSHNNNNSNNNRGLISKKTNQSIHIRKSKVHNSTNKRRRPFKGKRPNDSRNPTEMPFVKKFAFASDEKQVTSINSNNSRISIKEMPFVKKFLLEIENKWPNTGNKIKTKYNNNHIFTINNETIQFIMHILQGEITNKTNSSLSSFNKPHKDSNIESGSVNKQWSIICTKSGIQKNPFNCSKFIFCAPKKGLLFHFNCPEGLIYDEHSETCSSPNLISPCTPAKWSSDENENKQSSISTANSQIKLNSEINNKNKDDSDRKDDKSGVDIKPNSKICYSEGFFADPNNCASYFQCIKNQDDYIILYFNCSNGLFNEKSKTCDQSDNVSCEDTMRKEANIKDQQKTKMPDDESKSEITTSITVSTTTSTYTILSTNHSTFPTSNVSTPLKGIRTTVLSLTTIKPRLTTTKCIQSFPIREKFRCIKEGLFQDANDCQVFHRCLFNSQLGRFSNHKFKCSSGLVFDERLKICNFPENTQSCKSKINKGTERNEIVQEPEFDSSDIKPTINKNQMQLNKYINKMKECNHEGFFRDKKNPNIFYRCVNFGSFFQKFKFRCGSGLVFDERYNVCNWPSNVKL